MKAVFLRRRLPSGADSYDRQQFNLVTYDDGTSGIEGVPEPHLSDMTPRDVKSQHDTPEIFITDRWPSREWMWID